MDVVTGAMSSLAPKLLQLLQDEYNLQKDLRKQVEFLSRELESIYAALRRVAEVPPEKLDEQVKLWAREVREASYDMEDVLDTFLVRVDGCDPADPSRLKRAMKMGNLFSKAKARRDIAGAIEDIKEQLQEVADRRARYKVDEIVAKPVAVTSTIDPRLAAMYKEVTQLIGIDKSRDELISMLTVSQGDDVSDKNIMKVVSIVGVGGLGKTTLAKASYDKLKSQFDCRAFVSVGRNPDLVKVFKDILFDLDKNKYENIHNTGRGVDLLIRELREFLENKSKSNVRRFVKELGSLRKLRVLQSWIGSMDERMEKDLVESLRNFHKIQHLQLFLAEHINADIATWEAAGFVLPRHLRRLSLFRFRFPRLPSFINASRLHNLSNLELTVTTMDEHDLKLLGRLPELRFLSLGTESTVTVSNINGDDGCFQKLRCLHMSDSMVQFQCNEADLIVSFHIWNGVHAIPFGSRKNDCSSTPAAVMPNLEVLSFIVFVRTLKDGNVDSGNIGLEYLTALQKVDVWISCEGASAAEVKEAEAALTNAINAHPNRPTLELRTYNEQQEEISPTADDDVAKLSLATS